MVQNQSYQHQVDKDKEAFCSVANCRPEGLCESKTLTACLFISLDRCKSHSRKVILDSFWHVLGSDIRLRIV